MPSIAKNTIKVTKTAVKRAKNVIPDTKNVALTKVPEISEISDRDRVRVSANLLLAHLETTIKQYKARSQKSEAARKEKMVTLFGDKNTCMDNLVALTNLLLKLEQPEKPDPAINAGISDSQELTMSEADMALVDGFVNRMRGE